MTFIDLCGTGGLKSVVDECGNPYDQGTDADGNPAIIINKGVTVTSYSSAAGELPDPAECDSDCAAGAIAIDTDNGCVTHMCAGVQGWVSVCGSGATNLVPDQMGPAASIIATETCQNFDFPVTGGNPPVTQTVEVSYDGGATYTPIVFDTGTTLTICNSASSTCSIELEPSDFTGAIGDPVVFGGSASGPVQWETAASAAGPWSPTILPATVTAGNIGTFWRFSCLDDLTISSTAVTIIES